MNKPADFHLYTESHPYTLLKKQSVCGLQDTDSQTHIS